MKITDTILDHIDKPALIIDINFTITHINNLLKIIIDKDIKGKTLFDILPLIKKDDILAAGAENRLIPSFLQTINGELIFDIQLSEIILKNEKCYMIVFVGKNDKPDNIKFGLEIFHSISDPVSISDREGNILYTNESFKKLFFRPDDKGNQVLSIDLKNINIFLNEVAWSSRKSYSSFISLKRGSTDSLFDIKKMPVFNFSGNDYMITILREISQLSEMQNECHLLSGYLDAVNNVSSLLLKIENPENAATEVLELLGKATNACYACWHEFNTEDKGFSLFKKAKWEKAQKISYLSFDKLLFEDSSCVDFLKKLSTGEPLSILGKNCERCYPDSLKEEASKCSIKAKLLIPILKNGNITGIIEFGRCVEGRPWNSQEIDLLKTGVQNFAVAMEKFVFNKELRLFKQFVEASPGHWAILDHDFSFIFANKAFRNFYSIKFDENLTGKRYKDLLPEEIFEEDARYSNEAIQGKEPVNIDGFFENFATKKQRYLSKTYLPLFKRDGSHKATGIISKDISELKELKNLLVEQDKELSLFLSAIEQLPVAVMLTDENANIEYANPALERMTGYTKREYTGKNCNIFKSDRHNNEFYKNLWNTITSGNIWSGHFKNKKKDGSFYEEECTIVPIIDNGKITGYTAVKEDVTHKTKLEQELIQTQKLETAATLAGGMAHDFNNLIASIQSILEVMMARKEIKPESDSIKKIYKIIERAKGITGQILLISRPFIEEPKFIDINNSIKEIVSILRETADRKIVFETNLTDDELFIKIDPSMLTQVLLNILINDIQAMPLGGRIKITTEKVDSQFPFSNHKANGFGFCFLSISDTGHGMDEETKKKIFDPFFSTKPQGEGTGLGLTIVYRIIKNMRGNIFVESELKKGATFNIFMPLSKVPEIEQKDNFIMCQEVCLSPSSDPDKHTRCRIMIVDDEDDLRESLKEGLETLHYHVTGVNSGLEAYYIFKDAPGLFDLIILDMNMPQLNGLETLEKIREINDDIPAILATGFSLDDRLKAFKEKKRTMVLQKPFKLLEIDNAIKELLYPQNEKISC